MDGLKFSLLIMSYICDKGNKVKFMSGKCMVTRLKEGEFILIALRNKNIYVATLGLSKPKNLRHLSVQKDIVELCHQRLDHVSCSLLDKLVYKYLV